MPGEIIADDGFDGEIAAFFDRYVDAFARSDVEGIARLWDPVGLFPSPGGNFAMESDTFRDHLVT